MDVLLIVVMSGVSDSKEEPDTGDQEYCSKVSRTHSSKQAEDGSPRTQRLRGVCSGMKRIGRWDADLIVD